MATANYNIRLDDELKKRAFPVFESYGLTPSQAIKLFLNQVADTHVIPLSFEHKAVNYPNLETQKAIIEARQEFATATRYKSMEEAMLAMAEIAGE